jgi:hypothetical protein
MKSFYLKKIKVLTINFGPQNSAAHGVLCLILKKVKMKALFFFVPVLEPAAINFIIDSVGTLLNSSVFINFLLGVTTCLVSILLVFYGSKF